MGQGFATLCQAPSFQFGFRPWGTSRDRDVSRDTPTKQSDYEGRTVVGEHKPTSANLVQCIGKCP